MSLESIEWKEFVRRSLSASLIAEHYYCAAKVYNKKTLGEIDTPLTMAGTQIHEAETSKIVENLGRLQSVKIKTILDVMVLSLRNISSALRKKRVIANSEKHLLTPIILPESGLFGIPDIVDCSNGREPIIIDIKTTDRLPSHPWTNDTLQLGVYMMGIERLGFKQKYGILRYQLRNSKVQEREFRVEFDDQLKAMIANSSKDILRILDGGEPIPTQNVRKCIACGYKNTCEWSLAKE